MRRKLWVDLEELALALNDQSWENRYFLDLETGAIILLNEETGQELQPAAKARSVALKRT